MQRYDELLLENKAWATEMVQIDPQFFLRHAKGQTPNFLWIGCSDSRVSPDEIVNTKPGELFMHRNIANLVLETDMNFQSVLQYAVDVLEVKDIIVCGHTGCGGIAAALSGKTVDGPIAHWLEKITDVHQRHRHDIDQEKTDEARINRLVACNVREQAYNVARTIVVQKAWQKRQAPLVHGWVYDMQTGFIRKLVDLVPGMDLTPAF